jgi:chemotaxis response regulator CheB
MDVFGLISLASMAGGYALAIALHMSGANRDGRRQAADRQLWSASRFNATSCARA